MWGTTSFCDELTDDFGGPFEGTSIDDCRLFGRLAGIQSHGVLGLLQQYLPTTNAIWMRFAVYRFRDTMRKLSANKPGTLSRRHAFSNGSVRASQRRENNR